MPEQTIEEQIAAVHEQRNKVVTGIYEGELALAELNALFIGGRRVQNYGAVCLRQAEIKKELMTLRARASALRNDLRTLENRRGLDHQTGLGALPRHVLEQRLTEALAEIEKLRGVRP